MFEMPRLIATLRNKRGKQEVVTERFDCGHNRLTHRSAHNLRSALLSSFVNSVSQPLLTGYRRANEPPDRLAYGFTAPKLFAAVDAIRTFDRLWDVADLMEVMGRRLGVAVMATKWTLCHRFAPVFLESEHAYWIEVVRNPYAKISSGLRIGLSDLGHLTLPITQDALRFASTFKHERFRVLRYEEVCTEPDAVLDEISKWLGVEVRNRDLVNREGGPFHGNSSDNVEHGQPDWYQDQTVAPRLGALDRERWRQHLSPTELELINLSLDFCGLYPKEKTSPKNRAVAIIARYMPLMAYALARHALRSVVGLTGYDVVRRPRHQPL